VLRWRENTWTFIYVLHRAMNRKSESLSSWYMRDGFILKFVSFHTKRCNNIVVVRMDLGAAILVDR
jgi:hypothetical protein